MLFDIISVGLVRQSSGGVMESKCPWIKLLFAFICSAYWSDFLLNFSSLLSNALNNQEIVQEPPGEVVGRAAAIEHSWKKEAQEVNFMIILFS